MEIIFVFFGIVMLVFCVLWLFFNSYQEGYDEGRKDILKGLLKDKKLSSDDYLKYLNKED
jgi:hypothetical protein